MNTKKFLYIWLIIATICSVGFYFICAEFQYRNHFRAVELDVCPEQAAVLQDFYAFWQDEDWNGMAQISFREQDASFYEETLSSKRLDGYVITGYLLGGDDYTQFDVMLTVNGIDTLAKVKFILNDMDDGWKVNAHDWEFRPFDYAQYRTRVYSMNHDENLKYAIFFFAGLFTVGWAAYLARAAAKKNRSGVNNSF